MARNRSAWYAALGVFLLLAGPLAGVSLADFTLTGGQQLTISTNLGGSGYLYDQSQATLVPGGHVQWMEAHGASNVYVSGGSVSSLEVFNTGGATVSSGSVTWLDVYNTSIASVSSGSVTYLRGHDTGSTSVTGGSVNYVVANDASIANVSGGDIGYIEVYNTAAVHVFGGSATFFFAEDASTASISGGHIFLLSALGTSTVNFNASDYHLGTGLSLDGDRVLGTGSLSGKWLDGTSWSVSITENDPGAAILVPEPATLSLLALGGLAIIRRRKKA